MSAFTPQTVERLAALAQLQLAPEEIEVFARQLSDILEFARQVQAVDTSAIADADLIGLSPAAAQRDDGPEPSLPREVTLAAAPDADASTGLFKVPRVFNG